MATRVYGCSDDLIEFEGDVSGEVNCYDKGVRVVFSDGTILEIKYGKFDNGGIWEVKAIQKGSLLERIDVCLDEDADPYSDQAFFKDGLKSAYYVKGKMEKVS